MTTGPSEFSFENLQLFCLAILLSLAGLWLTPYPPVVDLPQHAAQVATLQELWSGNELYNQTFELNWFAPYTLTYLLLYALALVLPVGIAGKLLISACVAAVPLLTRQLLRATDSQPAWAWLTVPGALSVAFYWGFMPFLLAIPVGLYLWLLTIRFAKTPTPARAAGIAVCCVMLFFCHVLALGFTALIALVYTAALHFKEPRKLLASWLPYTAGLPLIAYWYFGKLSNESYTSGAAVVYGSIKEKALTFLSQPAGFGATMLPHELLISVVLLLFPLVCGARFSTRPERWVPLVVALLVWALMPAKAVGAILVYHRLSVFLLPLYLLALDFPEQRRPLASYLLMGVVAVTLLGNTLRFAQFNRETLGFTGILAMMEERRNIMYMPIDPWSAQFPTPIHFHTAMWYQVEKRGITDFNLRSSIRRWCVFGMASMTGLKTIESYGTRRYLNGGRVTATTMIILLSTPRMI